MPADVRIIGEYGIGFGSIENQLTDAEELQLIEIIRECLVPASFEEPITCGDERFATGTVATYEATQPRIKIFGALAGVYAGMVLSGAWDVDNPVKQMIELREAFAPRGIKLGGHTDTGHVHEVKEYIEAVRDTGDFENILDASKCGASDQFDTSTRNLAKHGNSKAFSRLIRFLDGANYDDQHFGQVVGSAKRLTGQIPGELTSWRGGYMLRALADQPEWIEVLKDDGLGLHGHRGALIVVNDIPNTTVHRGMVAEKVARHELLSIKKPNAFDVDNWAIPKIVQTAAELFPMSHMDEAATAKLYGTSLRASQLSTGMTLTNGSQRVIQLAA